MNDNELNELWDIVYKYGRDGLSADTVDKVLNIIEEQIPKKNVDTIDKKE